MLEIVDWWDEWIAKYYPDCVFYRDKSGEVYVGLGIDVDRQPLT